MQLVQTITVGAGGTTSIEFTNIPQDATDLLLILSARFSTANTEAFLRFNGDAGTNYTFRTLQGSGSSAYANVVSSFNGVFIPVNWSAATSNTFGNSQAYIPNYTSANSKLVSVDGVTENNATEAYASIRAGIWTGTSAITSLSIVRTDTASFVQNSTASLYKITRA